MERAFWGDNIKPDNATNLFLLQKMKKEISDGNLACVASVSNLVIARKLEREQKLGQIYYKTCVGKEEYVNKT